MRAGKPVRSKKSMKNAKDADSGYQIRVMLAEESPGSCSWIMPLLETCGYPVVARIHDRNDAVAVALREGADIVLVDTGTGKTGEASWIEEQVLLHAQIPVLFLAHSAPEGQQAPGVIPGPCGFLREPASAEDLRLAITATLGRCGAEKRIRAIEKDLQKLKDHTEAVIEQRTARLKKTNAQLHRLLQYLEVTERNLAIDALEIDLRPDTIVTESGGTGVITIGTDRRIVLMSEVAGQMLGWSLRECAGNDIGAVLPCGDPAQSSRMEKSLRSVLASGAEGMILEDMPILSRDKKPITLSISLDPILDGNSRVCGMLIAFGEAGKNPEYTRIQKQHPASLNLMVKGIAHDFNNILSSVLANIQLARTTIDEGNVAYGRLALAEESVLRAREISEQMLMYSGGDTSAERSADLAGILRNVSLQSVSGSKARCTFSIAEDVQRMPLDEDLIRQIFGYLFEFLSGFIPAQGLIEISADTIISGTPDHKMLSPADYARIRLSTEVFSMPKKELQALFLAGSSPATAIDLSVAESMIRKAGGVLHIRPHAESGIEITLYFPAHYEKFAPEARDTAVPAELQKSGSRQKILLMDDEDAILSATGEMLKFLGYDISVSHNGEEALEIYADAIRAGKPFNAVILDITIPGGLGAQETLPKLKELDPSVKAIISSGYSTNPMIVDYQSFGFVAAIIKPYGFRELGEALDITFRK
ncbi:response regulator [uncultured Methanoregula sp.]|uniref:response regulator n=1 Tax=uncultured Methanoregula sp. TaxID=1005933 RepID=UPI002AAAF730|nr:response regulator [uncultured Methanoregula sp.]